MPGPVPERSEFRRRRNKQGETRAQGAAVVEMPSPDSGWHEMARDWYVSLGESGQSQFYEPSDWQTARVWAELLSRQLSSGRPSSQMVAAWSAAATELLTTEGARRRLRLELERPEPDDEEAEAPRVAVMDRYRRGVGS